MNEPNAENPAFAEIPASLLLTSTQAASLLQVHESSIKRWCNQGDLTFSKTSGGHRRFTIDSLVAFATERSQPYPLDKYGDLQQELAETLVQSWLDGHLDALRVLLRGWLLRPEREHYPSLFQVLYRDYNVALGQLFDELICKLMFDVGVAWQEGRLPVGEEHLISQTIMSGMQRLYEEASQKRSLRKAPSPGVAIAAGADGSLHELGAFCIRLLLEEQGWKTHYPGTNLPSAELGMLQQEYQANLVCLSFVKPQRLSDLHRCLDTLKQLYNEKMPYALIVGGSALESLGTSTHAIEKWFDDSRPFRDLRRLRTMSEFAAWLAAYTPQTNTTES